MIDKLDMKFNKREQYIIKGDMSIFKCEKLGTFCNAIIKNYYKDFNHPDWKTITKKIKISKAEQKIGASIKLQKTCCDNLDKELIEYEENKEYTPKFGNLIASNYVNLLLKEYANKKMYERERIFFKEKFEIIKNAKNLRKQIKITTGGRHFQCLVYDIMDESGNTYIICKSGEIIDGKLQKWRYGSFRFLYITDVRYVNTDDDLCIKDFDEIEIEDKIFYNGIQFFLDDVELIKVKFSDEGIKKYNSIRNLRPAEYYGWGIKDKSKKEEFNLKKKRDDINNIKTFKCTRKQMEFYLFQFGGDAEILEPIDLREEFLEKYKKAVEVYSKPLEIDSKTE